MRTKGTIISLLMLMSAFVWTAPETYGATTKQERNAISSGYKLYKEKRFAEAEVQFRKALEANAASETAMFNLAASLLRQSGAKGADGTDKTAQEASALLSELSAQAKDVKLAELAAYNLGNMAFNSGDYAASIEQYKNALRRNPLNDEARDNLRLAQKKLQEQNQDKKDQNKDKEQEKDQQQDKQDQQQDQKQNQDKDQQQPPKQPEEEKGSISDNNAERILKAMENEEKATRARINSRQKKNGDPARSRQVTKPW